MPVRTSITVLEAFNLVYEICNNENHPLRCGSAAHKHLMDLYDLSIGGVEDRKSVV